MDKFENIKSYNQKYTEGLEKSIKIVMPKLIEAFTNIYGRKHQNYIEYTLKNLKYVYFISEKYLEEFYLYKEHLSDEVVNTIEYYLEYLDYLNECANKVNDDELELFVYKNYITKTDLNYETLINYDFIVNLDNDVPQFIFTKLEDYIAKVVMLPIYIIDLKTIIHELNHALYINLLCIMDEELIFSDMFTTIESEELINDYISELVFKEYLRIGGIIPEYLNRFKIGNEYEYNYELVKYLFDIFEPLILESLISENHNIFIKLVGENNFNKLCNLIKILYLEEYNESKFKELIELVDKMYDKADSTEIKRNETYIEEAESYGYQIRRLKK